MERTKKRTIIDRSLIPIANVILGIILAVYFTPLIFSDTFYFNSTDYAQYVGGIAGPLAALVGFIYVYLTFLGQQRQLDEQRKRMDKEEASREFGEYLSLWYEFRSGVTYSWDKSTGSKALDSFWSNVKGSVQNDAEVQSFDINQADSFESSLQKHLFESSFNKNSGQLENFLRMIYPLLEIAERGGLESRLRFLENLLTDSEKALLIYAPTYLDQNESAISLFRSGFCSRLPEECLISPDHRKLIF